MQHVRRPRTSVNEANSEQTDGLHGTITTSCSVNWQKLWKC
jgi:hypothetical protein